MRSAGERPGAILGLHPPRGQSKFWLGGTEICDAPKPRPRIELWQNGGVIYIGGGPTGDRFLGMLDEVILDPYDGSKPPNEGDGSEDETLVYLPSVAR